MNINVEQILTVITSDHTEEQIILKHKDYHHVSMMYCLIFTFLLQSS